MGLRQSSETGFRPAMHCMNDVDEPYASPKERRNRRAFRSFRDLLARQLILDEGCFRQGGAHFAPTSSSRNESLTRHYDRILVCVSELTPH